MPSAFINLKNVVLLKNVHTRIDSKEIKLKFFQKGFNYNALSFVLNKMIKKNNLLKNIRP